jgi:hypothetical protein
MPYHLMKYKTGFKVMDDKGREYSKRPISEKNAKAQMKALYAAEKDGILRHVKGGGIELYNPHTGEKLLIGDGFFGDIWTKIKDIARQGVQKVQSFAKGAVVPVLSAVSDVSSMALRKNYPPKVRQTLQQYGNGLIQRMVVRRLPIEGYVEQALSFMTRGSWQTMKQKLNYDKVFHLQLIAYITPQGINDGVTNDLIPFLIEKNEVIVIAPITGTTSAKVDMNNPNAETVEVPMSGSITLQHLMDAAQQATGPSFFTYDAFNNNCQIFINNILNANGLNNSELHQFIMQDTVQILQELPSYIKPVSRIITNIAGIADRIIQGEGMNDILNDNKPAVAKSSARSKRNVKMTKQEVKTPAEIRGGKMPLRGAGFFGDIWDFLGGQQKEINVRETIGDAPNAREYGLRPVEDIANEKTSNQWKEYNEKKKAIVMSREDLSKLQGELYDRASRRREAKVREYMNQGMKWSAAQSRAGRDPFYTQEEDCLVYNAKGITPAYCEQYTGVKQFSQPSYTLEDMKKDGKDNWDNFVKTENGQMYQQHTSQYEQARKQLENENAKIRDCNNSFGCAFKTALGNVSNVLSFIPGPIGSIAGAVSTGIDVVNTFTGQGKELPNKLALQLKMVGITPKAYMKAARAAAKANGYDPRALEFSDDGKAKFMIYDDEGKLHRFGRVGYMDFILYSHIHKEGAEKKRKAYLARATKIKGNWKDDKFSPNNLAINILW